MARRTSGSASRRARPARRRRGPPPGLGRSSRAIVLLLLLIVGAIVANRAGWLPERVAVVVQRVETWIEPLLRDAGLALPPRSDPPGTEAGGDPRPDDAPAAAAALALLDRLPAAPERRRGYDREDWPHWLDADGDCVDARDEVLAAESLEPVRWSADGCDVAGGLWLDVYTGRTYRDPSDLDVDHVIPLAEAHRSGGHAWSRERRAAFANDLGDARSLAAVSAQANRSKGDQGPEEWLPPSASARCRYAADWVAVKARWSLSIDERERVTLGNLLRDCAQR